MKIKCLEHWSSSSSSCIRKNSGYLEDISTYQNSFVSFSQDIKGYSQYGFLGNYYSIYGSQGYYVSIRSYGRWKCCGK